jgi:hypothetical protein
LLWKTDWFVCAKHAVGIAEEVGQHLLGSGERAHFSDSFPDAGVLLACASASKASCVSGRMRHTRSGTRSGWIKAKIEQWKAANQYRAKLFERRPS